MSPRERNKRVARERRAPAEPLSTKGKTKLNRKINVRKTESVNFKRHPNYCVSLFLVFILFLSFISCSRLPQIAKRKREKRRTNLSMGGLREKTRKEKKKGDGVSGGSESSDDDAGEKKVAIEEKKPDFVGNLTESQNPDSRTSPKLTFFFFSFRRRLVLCCDLFSPKKGKNKKKTPYIRTNTRPTITPDRFGEKEKHKIEEPSSK